MKKTYKIVDKYIYIGYTSLEGNNMENIINDMKEIFELATGCVTFVTKLLKLNNKNASLGYNSQLASSGDYSQLASSEYNSKLASSGDSSKLAISGYNSKLASSGYNSKLASSGDSSKLASSGDSSQLASSGDYSQLASSGYSSKLASSGKFSVISNIGVNGVAKAKKGSWITLAEYKNNKPIFVKTKLVDNKVIKQDTYYCLCDNKFCEYDETDGIKAAVISRRGSVKKVKIFGEGNISYIITVDNNSAHGNTIKEAREELKYKLSNRDKTKYKDYSIDTIVTKKEAIEMYMCITGACSYGTKNFVDNHKVKNKMKISEIIEITKGHYGNNEFRMFFEVKHK